MTEQVAGGQSVLQNETDKKQRKQVKSKSKSKKHGRSTTGVRGPSSAMSSQGSYNAVMSRNGRAFTIKSGDFTSGASGGSSGASGVSDTSKSGNLGRVHHATVASLASIKGNFVVQQLTKASQDLKMQHELRKALEELHAKEQDFLMAVEISDKLSKDNKHLNDEIEELRLQVQELNLDNQILAEKMHAISNSYQQDMNKYQNDLIESKELMAQLESELESKAKLVDELGNKNKSSLTTNNINNNKNGSNISNNNNNINNKNGSNMKSNMLQSISQLTSGQLSTNLEKELFVKLEQERRRAVEQMETFMEQMDEFDKIKKENEDLKTENEDLQEALKEQLQHQQHIQKAMQEEVIALAARNSNLEHQKDEYSKLLDQRDYEIDLLKQQIYLERKQSVVVARQLHAMSVTSETGNFEDLSNLPTIAQISQISQEQEQEQEYENDVNDLNAMNNEDVNETNDGNDKKDDEDLDDMNEINALIDDMIENDKSNGLNDAASSNNNVNNNNNNNNTKNGVDDVFVPDVIKEYLHLTASAVKIKFPKITNITSEELIAQTKSLPFFQYHDYCVRIMEREEMKQKEAMRQKDVENEKLRAIQKKKLQKRRSFLGLFGGLFGNAHGGSHHGSHHTNNKLGKMSNGDDNDNNNIDNIGNHVNQVNQVNQDSYDDSNNKNNSDIDEDPNYNALNDVSHTILSEEEEDFVSNNNSNNNNQLTTDSYQIDMMEDGYQSDGTRKQRHSASRFKGKNKNKRGVNQHASRRRLGGLK